MVVHLKRCEADVHPVEGEKHVQHKHKVDDAKSQFA
jgi:hypothetical protein